ncbi:hypothetical protein [Azospirillum oryzae]|uniref:hypothetical protein n=1 Tax=Azospirillum oryzae TaxID=286727 RepID=UPI001B3BAEF8|nr:hypothetical protein [Azospirillum oryzae]GLR77467.1 hypothetical protein GCM10007856_01350 [Azospirillum oryzae]
MRHKSFLLIGVFIAAFTFDHDANAEPIKSPNECAFGSLIDDKLTIGNMCNRPIYIETYRNDETLLVSRNLPPMSALVFTWNFGNTLYWINCEVGTRPVSIKRGGAEGCEKSKKKDSRPFTSTLVVNPRIDYEAAKLVDRSNPFPNKSRYTSTANSSKVASNDLSLNPAGRGSRDATACLSLRPYAGSDSWSTITNICNFNVYAEMLPYSGSSMLTNGSRPQVTEGHLYLAGSERNLPTGGSFGGGFTVTHNKIYACEYGWYPDEKDYGKDKYHCLFDKIGKTRIGGHDFPK